jgi:Rrf2 family cysteine metabolism transcriptional repressor
VDGMLKLSTKGRYGLRALMELASHPGDEPVMMSSIAENQDISRKYLHALLTSLKNVGIVRSVRGAQGGYTLARPASQIRLDEIIETLEGPLSVVDCVDDHRICPKTGTCRAHVLWCELSELLRHHLAGKTLQDLLDDPVSSKEADAP